MVYDIIGDIHGYFNNLVELLLKLGYKEREGVFCQSDRKAIFVGDFIDRGQDNFKVMETIKRMCDSNNALAVMGNHEYNAICYHTKNYNGEFLRAHSRMSKDGHSRTLLEINKNPDLWEIYMKWLKALPLFLDLPQFRVIHAFWHNSSISFFKEKNVRGSDGQLTQDFFISSCVKGSDYFNAVDNLLNGLEFKLPQGETFFDINGYERSKIRVKWWLTKEELIKCDNFSQIAISREDTFNKIKKIKFNYKDYSYKGFNDDNRPIFIGHYWFDPKLIPQKINDKIVCLDYSVAKNGKLVAYTWSDGDCAIDNGNFTAV